MLRALLVLVGLIFAGSAGAQFPGYGPIGPGSAPPPSTTGAGSVVNNVYNAALTCDGVTDNASVINTINTYTAAHPFTTVYFPPASQPVAGIPVMTSGVVYNFAGSGLLTPTANTGNYVTLYGQYITSSTCTAYNSNSQTVLIVTVPQ